MAAEPTTLPAAAAGTLVLGDLTVNRMGFGAMRITGKGIWGPPRRRDEALAVLRRAVELGVNLIDTADSYGPHVSEELIGEVLAPYDTTTVATKGGLLRTGPGQWPILGRPDYLRQCCELSLRRLKLDVIPLYQLHRIDPQVPLEDSVGELAELQKEGKIGHIGLSEVDVPQIRAARAVAEIVSVQNRFNLADRAHEAVLDYCDAEGIAFIPWYPVATGELARPGGILDGFSKSHGATPAQLALAWLLRRSPVMLPIPGTKSLAHLEENVAAVDVTLSDDEYAQLSAS